MYTREELAIPIRSMEDRAPDFESVEAFSKPLIPGVFIQVTEPGGRRKWIRISSDDADRLIAQIKAAKKGAKI